MVDRVVLPNFKVPSADERKKALGSFGGTNFKVKKALENVEKYWVQIVPPGPEDWLATQFESGQTFEEFKVNKNAIVEKDKCDTICIVPLDKNLNKKFLQNIQKMCQAFFYGCKVKILPSINIDTIEKVEKRTIDENGQIVQYNASKILSWLFRVYKPANPKSICIIGVTTQDIYPEENFNFVFGLANVMTQAGIFSFYRYTTEFNGDEVSSEEEAEDIILYRACKVMTHEIGHMFGIRHCTYYECGMNGSNHLQEQMKRPMYFCPVDFRKLQHAIGFNPIDRYKALIEVCKEFGGSFLFDLDWFIRRHSDLETTFSQISQKMPIKQKK